MLRGWRRRFGRGKASLSLSSPKRRRRNSRFSSKAVVLAYSDRPAASRAS